jgi:hypothetical protein
VHPQERPLKLLYSLLAHCCARWARPDSIGRNVSLGADFYTEMFGITYDVLDELGDISSDTARNFTVLNNNLVSGMQNLYQMVCVLLTALGAGVIALSAARFYSYAAGNSEMMKKTVETEARLSEILQKLTNESAQEDSSDAVEQSADDRGEVETPIA